MSCLCGMSLSYHMRYALPQQKQVVPKSMPIENIKPQKGAATGQMIPLLHPMYVAQTPQIKCATITFPDVVLMITGCCTKNNHKLFLKFHLKHVVYTDSNFESETYITSVRSAKG